MTKRTPAALMALLVAASTLAIVAVSPAGAHTQTVRLCAYDPFAGQQCWNESVSHTHSDNTPSGRNGDSDGPRNGGQSATPEQRAEAERQRQQAAAEREARQRAEREAREKAAREQAEREAREKAERETREREAREKAEREAREKAERERCAVSPRPANCRPHQQGNQNAGDDDDKPKNGSSMTVQEIINEFGSVLTCEWIAEANDKLGLACDAVTFATPVLISGVGGNTNEAEVLRDAGAWAVCYKVGGNVRVKVTCVGITIVVDPLTDAIKRLSNLGADRGKIQPPDPDKTDDSGSDAQPPPTGTTTPDDDDDSGTEDADPVPTPDPNDPDGDYDGDGKTTAQEATEAAIKHQANEITDAAYIRILKGFWCDRGDTDYCNE